MIGVCRIEARADFCSTCPHATCKARLTEQVKKSKYNVASKEDRTYKGRQFRSKLEADFAQHLDNLGLKWEYEKVKLTFWTKETPKRPRQRMTKLVDFRVKIGGNWELYECKGYANKAEKHKLRVLAKAIEAGEHPQVYMVTVPEINSAIPLDEYIQRLTSD